MSQNSVFDQQAFLLHLLAQAAERSSLEFQQVSKDRYGLLRTEWRVPFHLGLYGTMTAGTIGTAPQTHKRKLSRAVHRLCEKRYLTLHRHSEVTRVEHLELTARGRRVFDERRGISAEYDDALKAQLSQPELDALRSGRRKLSGTGRSPFT